MLISKIKRGGLQLVKKCEEFGVFKNNNGYYKREEIDKMTGAIISSKLTVKKDNK